MLSAIRASGVIKPATVVFDGALNASTFLGYVETCLAPALSWADIVVMDNLSSHKVSGVVEAIEAVGATVWYLPAYSPDLNPIEKMWSKVKAWLCDAAARTTQRLIEAVGEAILNVDANECQAYLQSCGYAT